MKKHVKNITVLVLALMLVICGCGKDAQTMAGNSASTQDTVSQVQSGSGEEIPESREPQSDIPESSEQPSSEPASSEQPSSEPEPFVEPEVDLIMVGDVLMHMRVTNSGKQADGSYNFDRLFEPTKEMVEEADLAIVNQEVIMGGAELGYSGYPRFNAPYALADSLVNTGFDVVLHATNHTMDKGEEGVLNCLNYWETNFPETAVIGMYDSQEERDQVYVYEQDGIRIAILNYTYGTNGIAVPEDKPYMVNIMKESLIKADIQKAKEVADFVIVCPHWGTEYVHEPSKWQRVWGEFIIDSGADLILGTHPHVIEPVEWVETEKGNKGLVYWSLGNYINSTASEGEGVADRMLGAMATVTIAKTEDEEVYIKEYGAEPLVTYVSGNGKTIVTYPMEEFTEDMANESSTKKKDPNFSLEYCKQVWEQVFGEIE